MKKDQINLIAGRTQNIYIAYHSEQNEGFSYFDPSSNDVPDIVWLSLFLISVPSLAVKEVDLSIMVENIDGIHRPRTVF